MARKQPERDFHNAIKKFMSDNGHRLVKLGTVSRSVTKNQGRRFYSLGTRHIPDALALMRGGIMFLIEEKVENHIPTNDQIKFAYEVYKKQDIKTFFFRRRLNALKQEFIYEVWDVLDYSIEHLEMLLQREKGEASYNIMLAKPMMTFHTLEEAVFFMYMETLERIKIQLTKKERKTA